MASKYRLRVGDSDHEVEVEPDSNGDFEITVGDTTHRVNLQRINESARYSLIVDGRPYDIFAEETPMGFHIVVGGQTVLVGTQTGRRAAKSAGGGMDADTGGEWVLKSPMSGVVREILVSADDEVAEGQILVVVEAMKMQNELHARRAGTVKAVYVSVGQRVDQGTPMLVLL
ncbi:MAG TPA: biotin/lipoyl-containing protein [Dehalococcoidia bacterium]|nr:biotin/lipoyl-containing protein [Dehalococcoidia bacterium]